MSSSESSSSGSEPVSPVSSGEQHPMEDEAANFDLPYGMSAYERHLRLQDYHQCIDKCMDNLKEQKLHLNLLMYRECESGCYDILKAP
ncbi:unnamed protein product [Cylicocyclus nassatus]|uniref:Uncharacterized protein n=1 Tax=Cylicocyclus nassatus TaxID=53992 RepID=A0AA36MFA0_CYLNA|nr:unnamed protein product [Cylicocyclus nassatus]